MIGGLTEAGTPKSIHTVPGWVSGKTQQPFSLSAQELKALSEGILTGIEHWIALALNGVTIFGVHPFEVLQAIGEKIREAESSSHVAILIQSGVDLLTTAVNWFLNKIGLSFPKLAEFLGGISAILAKFDPLSGEFDPVGAIRSLIQHIRTSAEDDAELAADLVQMITTAVGDDFRTVLGWARSTWTALGRLFGDAEGRLDGVIDSLGNFNLKQALINFFKNVLADIDAAEDLLTVLKNLVSRGGLQDLLDKVGGKIGAGLSDAENRLRYLLKDGTGHFQGLANILDDDGNQLHSWLANLDHTGVWTDLTQLKDSLGNPLQGGWLANLDHTGGWTDLTKLKDTLGNPLQGGWLANLDHTGFYDASQGFANRATSLLRYLDPSTGKWLDASKIVANVGGAVTDIETGAQNILDKVGGKLSAGLSDAEDRLKNLKNDGSGIWSDIDKIEDNVGHRLGDAIRNLFGAFDPTSSAIPHHRVQLPPNPGLGTITVDATSNATPVTGSSTSLALSPWSHTVGSTANYLVVRVAIDSANSLAVAFTAASFGSQTLTTVLGSSPGSAARPAVFLLGLADPTPSTANITIGVTTPGGNVKVLAADAISLTGVGTVRGSVATNDGTNSSPTLTISSATGDFVVNALAVKSPNTETLSAYSKTSDYNPGSTHDATSGDYMAILTGHAAGASTVTFSATASYTTANEWANAAVSFEPLSSQAIGSGIWVPCTNTTPWSAASGPQTLPDPFFDSGPMFVSPDLTYYNNGVQVSNAGWYIAQISLLPDSWVHSANAVLYKQAAGAGSPSVFAYGPTMTYISGAPLVGGTFIVYLGAGDILFPGVVNAGSGNSYVGEASGTQSFWSVSLMNRSLA